MKKCYLDTNVLVYFKDQASSNNSFAKQIINFLIENNYQLLISPLVLDEFVHIIRLNLINSPKLFHLIKKTLKQILTLPNLALINPPLTIQSQLKIITLMEKFSLRPRDAYHLLIMQAHHIKHFATFDTDFDKIFKAKLLFPIR